MSSTEDYLDKLLRGITGEPEPEPEPESLSELGSEPETEQEPVYELGLEPEPDYNMNLLSGTEGLVSDESINFVDELPIDIDAPIVEGSDIPMETDIPLETDIPVESDIPTELDIPVEADIPTGLDIPVETDIPTGLDIPVETDIPTGLDFSVEANIPAESDILLGFDSSLETDQSLETETIPTVTPVLAEENPFDSDISILDEAESLLADLPKLDENEVFEDNLSNSGIDTPELDTILENETIEPIAATNEPVESVFSTDEVPLANEPLVVDQVASEPSADDSLNSEMLFDGLNLDDLPSLDDIPLDDNFETITEPIAAETVANEGIVDEAENSYNNEPAALDELNGVDLDSAEIISDVDLLNGDSYNKDFDSEDLDDTNFDNVDLSIDDIDNISNEENLPLEDVLSETMGEDYSEGEELPIDLEDIDGELDAQSINEILNEDIGEDTNEDIGALESTSENIDALESTPENDSSIFNDEENLEDQDIAALLQDIENMGKEEAASDDSGLVSEDALLNDFLSGIDDKDISEIGDILSKDENNEPLDDLAGVIDDTDFTNGMLSEDELFDNIEDILEDEEGGSKKKKKRAKKEKKERKSKKKADSLDEQDTEKKPSLIKRILDVLLVSDDDELEDGVKFEETALDIAVEGAEENEAILAQLEEANPDNKKKKGKKKKKKGKGKEDDSAKEDGADDEDSTKDPKAAKKEEKERKKAEKARLREERKAAEALLPKKKLSKKKVIPICILCFSIGVAVTLLAFIMPSFTDKRKAYEQYSRRNYEETYSLLKGHKLNKKEQELYDKTVTLLQEDRKLDSYGNYMALDMKPEALNALVQGVKKYNELSGRAEELGVSDELNGIYSNILAELQNTFGVSVDKVYQWLSIENNEEYSYIINSYANGNQISTEGNIIEGMEVEGFVQNSDMNVWDNSVISAEEAEIQ